MKSRKNVFFLIIRMKLLSQSAYLGVQSKHCGFCFEVFSPYAVCNYADTTGTPTYQLYIAGTLTYEVHIALELLSAV